MVQKNWLEWSVFAVSGIVLLFVFGYLGYNALTTDGNTASVHVQLGVSEPQDGRYILPLELENRGGQSVEDIEIEVSLLEGGATVETAAITVPFLPRQSTREAWVVFESNPAEADEIDTRIIGYIVP